MRCDDFQPKDETKSDGWCSLVANRERYSVRVWRSAAAGGVRFARSLKPQGGVGAGEELVRGRDRAGQGDREKKWSIKDDENRNRRKREQGKCRSKARTSSIEFYCLCVNDAGAFFFSYYHDSCINHHHIPSTPPSGAMPWDDGLITSTSSLPG